MKLLKKFFKGALIGSLGQVFMFCVVIVPVYAAKIHNKTDPFFETYKAAFWNVKEIMWIMMAIAAVCWGLKEMIRLEE